jgi:hypothetical protein
MNVNSPPASINSSRPLTLDGRCWKHRELDLVLKKSDLYSSLWKSCDELRGGMDASQYKDYILTLLFVKYVSDKQISDRDSLIDVPEGGSFDDMVALKGDREISPYPSNIARERYGTVTKPGTFIAFSPDPKPSGHIVSATRSNELF